MDRDDMLELLEDDTVYAIGIEGVEDTIEVYTDGEWRIFRVMEK